MINYLWHKIHVTFAPPSHRVEAVFGLYEPHSCSQSWWRAWLFEVKRKKLEVEIWIFKWGSDVCDSRKERQHVCVFWSKIFTIVPRHRDNSETRIRLKKWHPWMIVKQKICSWSDISNIFRTDEYSHDSPSTSCRQMISWFFSEFLSSILSFLSFSALVRSHIFSRFKKHYWLYLVSEVSRVDSKNNCNNRIIGQNIAMNFKYLVSPHASFWSGPKFATFSHLRTKLQT